MDKNLAKELAKKWLDHPQLSRVTKVLEKNKDWPQIKMEIFPGDKAAIERINEAIEALKIGAGYLNHGNFINCFDSLDIALYEGGEVDPEKPIMSITGEGRLFLHLEDLLLNILSGNTEIDGEKIGTPFKSIFSLQEWSGLGSLEFQRFAQELKLEIMPNSLIAIYEDPIKAAVKFSEWNNKREKVYGIIPVIELNKDSTDLSLELVQRTAPQLYGICLHYEGKDPSLEQIRMIRKNLDQAGFSHVKLIAMSSHLPRKLKNSLINIFFEKKPNNCRAEVSLLSMESYP